MAGGIALSWVWAIGIIAFAFGIACGVVAAYLAFGSKRRTRELQEKLDALQREIDDYRGQVGQHFQRTAELVQKMTNSYREVYEHLASGSQSLCSNPINTPRLDIPETASLESKIEEPRAERPRNEEFSDAEVGSETTEEDDSYLGDAPNVPVINDEQAESAATPRTRLQ